MSPDIFFSGSPYIYIYTHTSIPACPPGHDSRSVQINMVSSTLVRLFVRTLIIITWPAYTTQYSYSCGEIDNGDYVCNCVYIRGGGLLADCDYKELLDIPSFTNGEMMYLVRISMSGNPYCRSRKRTKSWLAFCPAPREGNSRISCNLFEEKKIRNADYVSFRFLVLFLFVSEPVLKATYAVSQAVITETRDLTTETWDLTTGPDPHSPDTTSRSNRPVQGVRFGQTSRGYPVNLNTVDGGSPTAAGATPQSKGKSTGSFRQVLLSRDYRTAVEYSTGPNTASAGYTRGNESPTTATAARSSRPTDPQLTSLTVLYGGSGSELGPGPDPGPELAATRDYELSGTGYLITRPYTPDDLTTGADRVSTESGQPGRSVRLTDLNGGGESGGLDPEIDISRIFVYSSISCMIIFQVRVEESLHIY